MLKKHQQVFITIAVIAIGLMTLQSKYGQIRPFWFVSSAIDRTNSAMTYFREGLSTFLRVATLNEAKLMDLKRQNMELRFDRQDYKRLYHDNARLRAALEFTDNTPGFVAVARVISRGGDRISNFIVIDKGELHGIQKDMVVIVPEGLIGKVFSVEDKFSRVLLVDDSRFSAAVRLDDSRAQGVYSGLGSGKGTLKYVRTDVSVINGTSLTTSGLDALFPPGLTVGSVRSVETDDDQLFHNVNALPAVDLARLEEVTIVTR